jgi:uncharacterized protein (DUF58 family)
MYREERELTVFILMDISPSMHRMNISRQGRPGSQSYSPYEQGLISAALIAFAAEHTGQQTGAVFFDKDTEKVFPPRKGRRHIMAFIMAAIQHQNNVSPRKDRYGSNIASALQTAQRLLKRRSLVVLISDFFSINWEKDIENLCRKHDVITLRICDPPGLPYPGLITMEDPETGVRIEAPAGMPSFREAWTQWHSERSALWENQCRRSGAAFLELTTEEDAPSSLLKFFGRYSANITHGQSQNKYRQSV